MMDGGFDPAISEMLSGGDVDLVAYLPDCNRYRIALLKHAYLASCLEFGVPEGQAADLVRHDLIAARDSAGRDYVPLSRVALGLTVLRSYESTPAVNQPATVAVVQQPDGLCMDGVLLAGRIFVSWSSLPSYDDELGKPRRVQFRLKVGGMIEGTLSLDDDTS